MIAQVISTLLVAGSVFFTIAASDSGSGTSIDRHHPGRTNSSGCHVCRTNCDRWGVPYGQSHRHGPVRPCHQTAPPTRTPTPSPTTRPPARTLTRTPTQAPDRSASVPRARVSPPAGKLPFLDLSNTRSVIARPRTEIANTGGIGIALRGRCLDAARTTLAWPEGLGVVVFARGTGNCVGWSVVGANGSHTWVRDRYLKGHLALPAPKTTQPPAKSLGVSIDLSNSRSLDARPLTEIANTGGLGIALRARCADSARSASAWPEGRKVILVFEGTGPCLGWSVVSAAGLQTWVRNRYLQVFGVGES